MEEDTDIDPYEEQLLAVFRNCDKNNTGILDNDGFDQLCDALQLEENYRNLLIASLCDGANYKITFAQFRDALLKLLASFKIDSDQCNDSNANHCVEPGVTSSSQSITANKKYGRRSRPSSSIQNDAKLKLQTVTLKNDAQKVDVHESTSLVATNESSISASSRDLQVETLCDYLGVCKNSSIDDCNLVSICTALGLTHSIDDIIREIKLLKGETACAEGSPNVDLAQVPPITYGEFFELIRTLEFNKSSSMIDSITRSIENSTFGEDNIWNVDMNSLCCIGYDALVYLFESSGINDAGMFLNDLGVSFNVDVNLSELAIQLQKELIDAQKCLDNSSKHLYSLRNPHFLLLQALVVVYQAQIKWYKSCMEQMQCEKDKLRNDLAFANERASLLASEVDDNHARMEDSMQQKLKNLEHKYSDQIRELTHQWCSERDQLTNQNMKMEKQLQQLLCDEISLRSDVATLKQDYENIEKENKNLLDQLTDAENFREDLEKEIQRLSFLKQKVKELENSNEQAISFLEKMNQLQAENNKLRDKNDELVIELENITLREMQNRNTCSKRRGNSPLEGEEKSIGGGGGGGGGGGDVTLISTHRMFSKVRKCDAENDVLLYVDLTNNGKSFTECSSHVPVPQSPCESGVEADISTPYSSLDVENTIVAGKLVTNDTIIAQLKSRINFLETFIEKCKMKITCDSVDANDKDCGSGETKADDLEKQCENLQQKLDQVQNEILKILLEKRVCSEENCALKMKISQLMERLPVGCDTKDVESDARPSQNTIAIDLLSIDSKQNVFLDDSEALQMVEKERNTDNAEANVQIHRATDSSRNVETTSVNVNQNQMEWRPFDNNANENENENAKEGRNYVQLVQKYSRLTDENKTLAKKCNELESCLTMLRNEYDQCEEYWSMKLDEERKLFEQEQRMSDDKFAQLQLKIEEYGEMFNTETAQLDLKLPPIAENDNLEKEVNDLQEEFAAYKRKMERENKEKQIEIDRLTRIINNYEMPDLLPSTNINNDEARSLESIRSDKTYTIPNENPSLNSRNISFVKTQQTKLAHLKMRKKRLKKECSHLEREKNALTGNLCRMKSESRMLFTFSPCTYALQQQQHAEISTNGLFNRLRLQEVKNRYMRSIMSQQQKKLNKTMREMLHQQEKELSKYRSALASSQQISQSLQQTSKKQAEQIAVTDVLVKELYCENSQLMTTIHQLEQQHLDCQTPVLL